MWGGNWSAETHENQGGVKVLIAFFHALGIVLRRLSFVRGVEIGLGVIVFDRLEVQTQGLLYACYRGQFGDDS
jgi:hypothetical protein